MISAQLLLKVDSRLKQITGNFQSNFGGLDIILIGDLRQLPPVRSTPNQNRRSLDRFYGKIQNFSQANQQFSSILTKIGNSEQLDEMEITLIESRFYTVEEAEARCPQVLSETWLGNESYISIPNFKCIVKYKRPNTRAGGVAIYQNSSDAVNIITPSMECSVSQSDIYGTIVSSVGDLCLAECVIDNGQKIIIVAVYITPNKKLDDIIEFRHLDRYYHTHQEVLL
ncbi:ATP-dependent DNA helicase [Trichonephila clavipes]|nr:ATP-dependent DNA helicase [Trichonephila clavipes]